MQLGFTEENSSIAAQEVVELEGCDDFGETQLSSGATLHNRSVLQQELFKYSEFSSVKESQPRKYA